MGLDPAMRELGGTWIAWGDGDADRIVADANDHVQVPPETGAYTLSRVWLSEDDVDAYYYGFSNQVLWPICHGMPERMRTEPPFWRTYSNVNETFANAVVEESPERPTVWFQDYHFALAPSLVRERLPDRTRVGQFWHIPWPSWETFRVCPYKRDVLGGLLGNDVLGFHLPRYARNFLECVDSALDGAGVEWDRNRVRFQGRTTTVESRPMGVPVDDIRDLARSQRAREYPAEFRTEHDIDEETALAIGVDRLDYTKGIPHRLDALERLWESEPEWQGEFTYVQNASVSRSRIPAYERLQDRVTSRVDEINERFGTAEWTPVVYTTEMIPREDLIGLYRDADAAIVSPIRDGLNLVAQEYVAAQVGEPGALILSETAGSHDLIGESALSINPFETDAFARTIAEGLTMSPPERRRRVAGMRRVVGHNDLHSWVDHCLGSLQRSAPAKHVRE